MSIISGIVDWIILFAAIRLTSEGNFQYAVILFLFCIYSRLNLIVDFAINRRGVHYDKWKIRRRISQNIWRKI